MNEPLVCHLLLGDDIYLCGVGDMITYISRRTLANDSIYNDASLHRNPESMRQAALLAESGTVSQARHQNSAVAVAQMAVLHSLTGILAHKTNSKSLCAARTIF